MIDCNRLKGVIAENGMSQRKVARSIGISEKTFYEKMKKGVFSSNEIEAMLVVLKISDPETTMSIFFPNNVA